MVESLPDGRIEAQPLPGGRGPLALEVPARALAWGGALVVAIDAFLIVMTLLSDLGVAWALGGFGQQFDLKLEGNFAVWHSSVVLLLAGFGAFFAERRTRVLAPDRFASYAWWLLGACFIALSLDETAQLHERIGTRFTKHVAIVPGLTDAAPSVFGWLVALSPLIVAFVVCVRAAARQLTAADRRSRRLMLAALGCWLGVLVAEFVQAQLIRAGLDRSVEGVLEEGLEIAGSTLFLFAFVELLRTVPKPHRSLPPR